MTEQTERSRYWRFLTKRRALRFPAFIENSPIFPAPGSRKKLISTLYFLMFAVPLSAFLVQGPAIPDIISELLHLFILAMPVIFLSIISVSRLRGERLRQTGARVLPLIYTSGLLITAFQVSSSFGFAGLVLLTLLTLIAAAFLDIGLALAVWFGANIIAGPQASLLVVWTSGWLARSEPPLLLLELVGGIGALPLFFYVRNLRQKRILHLEASAPLLRSAFSNLGIAGLVVLAAILISLASSWVVARQTQGIAGDNLAHARLSSIRVLANDVEAAYENTVAGEKNYELSRFLVQNAARTNQNLYIFERAENTRSAKLAPYRLVVGTRKEFSRGRFSGPQEKIMVIRDLSRVGAAERKALSGWLRRMNESEHETYLSGELLGAFGGPPISIPLPDSTRLERNRLKKDRLGDPIYIVEPSGRSNSGRILVSTSAQPQWWEEFPSRAYMIGVLSTIFPILYSAILFLVSITLLILLKRQELRRQLIQAEERARINQEAHDRISNRLSALAIAAETHGGRQAEGQEFFGQLPETLRRIVTDLKDVTSEKPGAETLGVEQFKARLEAACAKRAAEHGFNLTQKIVIEPDVSIPAPTAEAIVSCLEEALGNVAKHAAAENVAVSVECRDYGECRLTVRDDGRGFMPPDDLEALKEQGHQGLAGMADRLERLGGRIVLEAAPGKGTRLEIVWRGDVVTVV